MRNEMIDTDNRKARVNAKMSNSRKAHKANKSELHSAKRQFNSTRTY